jgi:hypothetical protein
MAQFVAGRVTQPIWPVMVLIVCWRGNLTYNVRVASVPILTAYGAAHNYLTHGTWRKRRKHVHPGTARWLKRVAWSLFC